MKLNYNAIRTITTADLFDACDPPLIFEVKTKPGRTWARLDRKFDETGNKDIEIAKQLIAEAFLTVSDGENTYDLRTIEQIENFGLAIDELSPDSGGGDEFLCAIAWGYSVNHYDFLAKNLASSRKLLTQLNGSGQKVREPAKVS
jgi:hypothetical protein